jgi:hypothetical protein
MQYKYWPQANDIFKWAKVSPQQSKRRASQESWSQREDRNDGLRNRTWELSSNGKRWTSQNQQKEQPPTVKSPKTSHPLSKQNPESIDRNRELRLSHGQNCTPHSPEETFKRRAFSQFLFIHFCNGCSARDTRPKNLTKRVVFNSTKFKQIQIQ